MVHTTYLYGDLGDGLLLFYTYRYMDYYCFTVIS